MTGPAFLIARDPKESGRQIGFASPLPRVCRCTPMLLQQGNACPVRDRMPVQACRKRQRSSHALVRFGPAHHDGRVWCARRECDNRL